VVHGLRGALISAWPEAPLAGGQRGDCGWLAAFPVEVVARKNVAELVGLQELVDDRSEVE